MVELLKAAEFSEFRYEKGDLRIVIRRGDAADDDRPARAPAAVPTTRTDSRTVPGRPPAEAESPRTMVEGADIVTAPLLGTFYARPQPGEPPFVKIGDLVQPDTVLCIVEVMKLMNSVNAGRHGVVAAAHVEDGQLVEFGQALFSIVPSDS